VIFQVNKVMRLPFSPVGVFGDAAGVRFGFGEPMTAGHVEEGARVLDPTLGEVVIYLV
jgi:hypothetical protein